MAGNQLAAEYDLDAIDIDLQRHLLKSSTTRHAVTIGVEADHLILVDLGRRTQAGVEGRGGQGQGPLLLPREALADGLALTGLEPRAVAQAAAPQVGVQLGQVPRLRYRRRPVALQMPHPPLDVRLLLRPTYQTKQRLKGVMTAQRLIAVVHLARAAEGQVRRQRLGIVPPHFVRHTAEELKTFDHAVQNGLGPLGRQRQGERGIGVSPGEQQHRHLPTALGEVDVDVAEVGFEALARIVVERDERLPRSGALAPHIAADAVITAGVAMLVAEPPKDLGGSVLLLGWCRRIDLKNRLNDRLERIDDRRRWLPLIGLGFSLGEDLADFTSGMMKLPRQLANAHLAAAMRMANACIFVHRDHPPPPVSWIPWRCTSLQEIAGGGSVFGKHFSRGVGPDWTSITSGKIDTPAGARARLCSNSGNASPGLPRSA